MNIDLTDEAIEFGVQAMRALEAAGGDELVLRAEADPDGRAALVEPTTDRAICWASSLARPWAT